MIKRYFCIDVLLIFVVCMIIVGLSCCSKNEYTQRLPIVESKGVRCIANTSAVVKISILSPGTSKMTGAGIVYSFNPNPDINDNVVSAGNVPVIYFEIFVDNLIEGSEYYVRPYAKNKAGISYGEEIRFTTRVYDMDYPCPEMPEYFIDDRDGEVYTTVQIGNQCWISENIKYLPELSSDYSVWNYSGDDIEEAKSTENYAKYGSLYSWTAALDACPVGWKLPSDDDWTKFVNYLCCDDYAGLVLKDIQNWKGMTGKVPVMMRGPGLYEFGEWWSSTTYRDGYVWVRTYLIDDREIGRMLNHTNRHYSVRCIKK